MVGIGFPQRTTLSSSKCRLRLLSPSTRACGSATRKNDEGEVEPLHVGFMPKKGTPGGLGFEDLLMEESDGSGIHMGWDPSVAFASDELAIAPSDFADELSPLGSAPMRTRICDRCPTSILPPPHPSARWRKTTLQAVCRRRSLTVRQCYTDCDDGTRGGGRHRCKYVLDNDTDIGAGHTHSGVRAHGDGMRRYDRHTTKGTRSSPCLRGNRGEGGGRACRFGSSVVNAGRGDMEALVSDTESEDDRGLVRDCYVIDPVCASRKTKEPTVVGYEEGAIVADAPGFPISPRPPVLANPARTRHRPQPMPMCPHATRQQGLAARPCHGGSAEQRRYDRHNSGRRHCDGRRRG